MSQAAKTRQTKAARQERKRAERERRQRLSILAVVVVVLATGAFFFWPRPRPALVDAARLADDPALGPETAAVTIVEYGDFGCPSCRAWHRAGILDQVLEAYGDQVRFVWRDFPIITPQSPKAAEAGQCAYDQGRFWEFHDFLYEKATALGVNELKSYAAELGMDTERFNTCLDSGQHEETVDRDLRDAFGHNFRGTPSFLVNDHPLAGPPSLETLQSLINSNLPPGG